MAKKSKAKRTRTRQNKIETAQAQDVAPKDYRPTEVEPPTVIKEYSIEPGGERMREEILEHHATGTRLTGGDVDADWESADDVGSEAVGGHAPTPDQDEVDAIGRALGVEQDEDGEVKTHEEILSRRDRDRWELDRRSAGDQTDTETARTKRRRRSR